LGSAGPLGGNGKLPSGASACDLSPAGPLGPGGALGSISSPPQATKPAQQTAPAKAAPKKAHKHRKHGAKRK
jgi:hypothetical protein